INRADHQRRPFANGNNLLRIVSGEASERKHSAQFRKRFYYSVLQTAFEISLDEMGDNFGVGFGGELVAFLEEPPFQLKIVFDNAIMRDHNPTMAVTMWMGVLFGGSAMCGPSRMAQSELTGERLFGKQILEVPQLPGTSANRQLLVLDDRDAGRIVATIFE